MVDGLVKLMEYNGNGIFNLGSPEPRKVGEVANLIMQLAGVKLPLQTKVPPAFLAKQGVPDITKVKETLGWFPLIPLEQGLRQAIDYFRAHQNLMRPGSAGPV